MKLSIFKSMTTKQPSYGTLESVTDLIRSDEKLKAFTLSYRQTGNKTFKSECPLFAVACLFEGGKGKENIKGLTGLSLVDFDHIVSTPAEPKQKANGDAQPKLCTDSDDADDKLAELKKKICSDPHTVMCYTTISGNGLRIIYSYDLPRTALTATESTTSEDSLPEQTDKKSMSAKNTHVCLNDLNSVSSFYQQAFFAGNAYYKQLLGIESDGQCKNITRLSGLAHDPDVFVRPVSEATPFTMEEIATSATSYAKQSKENKQMQRIQTYYDTLIAPQLAKAGIKYMSGNHNNYVMRVGYKLAERRFSRQVAIRWAMMMFQDYSDTEQVMNSCYDNATPSASSNSRKEQKEGKYASVGEIKSFLDGHVSLRFNEITSRVEYSSTESVCRDTAPSTAPPENGLSASDNMPSDVWHPISDRLVNSLWTQMSAIARVNIQDMYRVIESDYVPAFNPFKDYLNSLEIKSDNDFIRDLADTVRVKGDDLAQEQWYCYLKKWLVGMVASWTSDNVVNNVILVLIGEQGSYKTTWFNYLLPPPLKQYFYTKTNANRMSKDDLLTLAQYALVCCEELDTMRPSELSQLKAAVTMPSIDERAAYAHYHEHRKHIASFCGTGNNVSFLSDPTGNRRWLPFEVESITSPREHPFPYEGIYAQAYALYKSGFQYWFSKDEILLLNRHNKQFETPHLEHELVDMYFRKPTDKEMGEFISVARALQIISYNISQKLSAINVGRAFNELGFCRVRTKNSRGFIVVCRTGEEIKAYHHSQMIESKPDTFSDLPY